MLYLGSARFFERPHIFSYLLAALVLWLFLRYREGGRDRRWLYAIIPVQVLWVNLHGGWVEGVALVAVFAAGELLAWLRARYLRIQTERALPARDVGLLAALVPAGLVASLINPYGYRALLFPFQLTGLQLFMQEVYEWRPPWDPSFNTSTAFVLYLLFAGALFLSFFAAGREPGLPPRQARARKMFRWALAAGLAAVYLALAVCWFGRSAGWWDPAVLRTALLALLVLFVLFVLDNFRTVDYTQAGIVLLFYALSLRLLPGGGRFRPGHERRPHRRGLPLAGGAAPAPAVLRPSGPEEAEIRPASARRRTGCGRGVRRPLRPGGGRGGALLLLGLSLHGTLDRYYLDFDGTPREAGFGVAANIPLAAVDFLARNGIAGNAFASYSHAALLIHRLGPAVKVGMDSRNDVYGEALYAEYRAALECRGDGRLPQEVPRRLLLPRPRRLRPGQLEPAWTAARRRLGAGVPRRPGDHPAEAGAAVPAGHRARGVPRPPAHLAAAPGRHTPPTPRRSWRRRSGASGTPRLRYGHFYRIKALLALGRWEDTVAACEQLPAGESGRADHLLRDGRRRAEAEPPAAGCRGVPEGAGAGSRQRAGPGRPPPAGPRVGAVEILRFHWIGPGGRHRGRGGGRPRYFRPSRARMSGGRPSLCTRTNRTRERRKPSEKYSRLWNGRSGSPVPPMESLAL